MFSTEFVTAWENKSTLPCSRTPDTGGVSGTLGSESYPLCDLRKLATTLTDQSTVHLQTQDALGIC